MRTLWWTILAFHLREVHKEIDLPLAVLCYMDETNRQFLVSMGNFGLIQSLFFCHNQFSTRARRVNVLVSGGDSTNHEKIITQSCNLSDFFFKQVLVLRVQSWQ